MASLWGLKTSGENIRFNLVVYVGEEQTLWGSHAPPENIEC